MTRIPPADALFGKTLQRVLGLLFGSPGRGYYLREIVAHAGGGSSQVQTELARLTAASLLIRERRANQVWYRANPEASIYPELRGIARKTFGVAGVLKEALEPARSRIEVAFVFGSTAKGEDTAESDVDLFLVGELSMADIAQGLAGAEAELRRTVSPVIMGAGELAGKRARAHHFVTTVLEGPRIFVEGDEESLDEILRRPPAKPRRKGRVASR